MNNELPNTAVSAETIGRALIDRLTNVLIVDDEAIIRTGIRKILGEYQNISIVGEASNGEEAEQLALTNSPNVILMDISMPGQGGIETTKRVLMRNPHIRVLALSVHNDEHYPSQILSAGALGYITKGVQADEMVRAIETVAKGEKYICSSVAQKLRKSQLLGRDRMFECLTNDELKVCTELVMGCSEEDICEKFGYSKERFKALRHAVFNKMDIESEIALIHLAIRNGLLDKDSTFFS